MADGLPEIVVHAPSDVTVDDSAENVTATPIVGPGPLPPPPQPGSGIQVMLAGPEDLLSDSGERRIAVAARDAGQSGDILTVSLERADTLGGEALARLTGIAEEQGVSRIHVYVQRRG